MRPHSRTRPRGENGSYWTSYSDMMAGLMLVFALVMFFSIFQFLDLQEQKTAEIATKEAQLADQQSLLISQEAELADKEALLQISLEDLSLAQTQLDEQEELLSQSTLQLTDKQTEYDEQAKLLLAAQQSLTEQQELMDAQQVKIDNLIGIRSRIIQDLSEELRKANLDATVDRQTGAITLKGAVLFEVGSNVLSESGMELLNSFVPVYIQTLLSEENREYVGEIIIEGHADSTGNYLSNLDLSQRRALAVATYCLQDGFGGFTQTERDYMRTIVTANGRSSSNPIYNADGTENLDASRRVEFKFRLKDAEMIDEMSQILEAMPQTEED